MAKTPKRLGRTATITAILIILVIIVATGYFIWLCIALTTAESGISMNRGEAVSLPTVSEMTAETVSTEPAATSIADVSATTPMQTVTEETEATTASAPIVTEPEINAENWKQIYHDFIIKDAEESEYSHDNNVDYFSYHLVYLDEDEIPELWINYAITAAGCRLVTSADGKIHNTLLGSGWISYFDYQNLFCHFYGKTGSPTIYSLDHGSLVTLASGGQYKEEYIWNDVPVSKEVYHQNLYAHIDLESAKDTMQPEYTYSEILEYLSGKNGT